MFTIRLRFHSPRWGHEDTYTFDFTKREISIIAGNAKRAKCTLQPDGDVVWTGHSERIGNPLVKIMEEDDIYLPDIFLGELMCYWNEWRIEQTTEEEFEVKLVNAAEYLNTQTLENN